MYSPRIPERYIPVLYHLGQARGRPMTQLVAEAVERYLVDAGCWDGASEGVWSDEVPARDDRIAA